MTPSEESPFSIVCRYYSNKVRAHGPTPLGVDWNGTESQQLRFTQLLKLSDEKCIGTLNDLGCGYGALCDFLIETDREVDYLGVDISEEMVAAARTSHSESAHCRFIVGERPDRSADYTVASGIFNVRPGIDDLAWRSHIESVIDSMRESSTAGFSFNCLTLHSDRDRRKDYLYYADPCDFFNLCKTRYSRNVALLHDYDLYEFTVLVRL